MKFAPSSHLSRARGRVREQRRVGDASPRSIDRERAPRHLAAQRRRPRRHRTGPRRAAPREAFTDAPDGRRSRVRRAHDDVDASFSNVRVRACSRDDARRALT